MGQPDGLLSRGRKVLILLLLASWVSLVLSHGAYAHDSSAGSEASGIATLASLILLAVGAGFCVWLWRRHKQVVRSLAESQQSLAATTTALSEVEAKLRVSQAEHASSIHQLSEVIARVPVALALWDADDRLVVWNQLYFNYHAELGDVIARGTSLESVASAAAPFRVAAGVAATEAEFVASRLAMRAENWGPQYRPKPDGSVHVVEDHPLPPDGTLEAITDVTALTRGQQQLERQQNEIASILEGMPDALVMFDTEDRMAWWNARYLELFPPVKKLVHSRPTFKEVYESIAGPEAMPVEERMALHRAEGARIGIEFEHPSGRTYQVREAGMDDGSTVVTFSDVSKLKQQERELERSNAELEQFAYVASHDLQAPLRTVASFSRLLNRKLEGELDERSSEFLDHISSGTSQMQSLVDALLSFSRVGRNELTKEPVDLSSVLRRVEMILGPAIDESRARIEHDSLPQVLGSESLLTQLLQNLIENAIKFRRDTEPVIRVEARIEERICVLSVQDNGMGIAAEHRERIFAPFKRLHRKDDIPGNGIGLALCRKIAALHGGTISLESEVGVGTTFHVTLDVVSEHPDL